MNRVSIFAAVLLLPFFSYSSSTYSDDGTYDATVTTDSGTYTVPVEVEDGSVSQVHSLTPETAHAAFRCVSTGLSLDSLMGEPSIAVSDAFVPKFRFLHLMANFLALYAIKIASYGQTHNNCAFDHKALMPSYINQ